MEHDQRQNGLPEWPWKAHRTISISTDDHRESAYLFQRLSVLIRRYNAVTVPAIFAHTAPEDEM